MPVADISGERLGPFEVHSLIGTGGFATVYRAHDPRLGTDVALKILAENHSLDPSIRERFLGEANALRRVDSPAVVRIYDIRETPDARPYLVLEFADRGDLVGRRRSLTANGWSPNSADLRVLIESLAEALDAVHAEELVHRDITPSNLLLRSGRRTTSRPGVRLLEPDERFMLSDMGLVKDLSAGSSLTVGGGTAGFWAPEQQQAMASVDHRTDIFSASALVVWFLTGETVTTNPVWDDSIREQGWPAELIRELQRALSADPADRHQSIREWEHALASALASAVASPFDRAEQSAPAVHPHDSVATEITTATASKNTESAVRNRTLAVVAGLTALLIATIAGFILLRDGAADESLEDEPTGTTASVIPQIEPTPTNDGASEPTPGETPQDDEPDTRGSPVVAASSVDTWGFAIHPNGSQLTVEQVITTRTETTLEILVLNGRDFNTVFRADDRATRLATIDASFALLDDAQVELSPGDTFRLSLKFAPLPADATFVSLEFNLRADDEQSIDEGRPGFLVALDLTTDLPPPPLPAGRTLAQVAVHPNNSSVWATRVLFSATHIGLSFIGTNGSPRRVSFSAGHHASFLEDDLGNRYWLKFADSERFIRVDDGFSAQGTLAFAGRVHPDATSLRLVLNHEESTTDDSTTAPKFDMGPWSLDGSLMSAPPIEAIRDDRSTTHANGTVVTMDSISFELQHTAVTATISNSRRLPVRINSCCYNTFLLDDLGHRYLLLPPLTNETVVVESGETLTTTLVFPAAINPQATSLTLIVNDRDDTLPNDPETSWPDFEFGPYPLVRAPALSSAEVENTDFGTTTTWLLEPIAQQ